MTAHADSRPVAVTGDLSFRRRHIGPGPADLDAMLAVVGYDSLDALIATALPTGIRSQGLELPDPIGEEAVLAELAEIAAANHPVAA